MTSYYSKREPVSVTGGLSYIGVYWWANRRFKFNDDDFFQKQNLSICANYIALLRETILFSLTYSCVG